MQLKAKEVYEMYDAINSLSKEKTSMPTAYYIAKNTKLIKEEVTSIDDARQRLIMDFGEKKEDGTLNVHLIMQKLDFRITYNEETIKELIQELIASKIINENQAEYINIQKIPLSALQGMNIPINYIEVLLPIIEDDMNMEKGNNQKDTASSAELTLGPNGEVIGIK